MSKARFDTLANLDDTESRDVTQLLNNVSDIISAGVSVTQTKQSLDSNSDLDDFTAGFFLDSWFGSKPANAPSNFSDYGTFVQLGRTQIVIDNSDSAFSGMAVRSYNENNVFTDWRSL